MAQYQIANARGWPQRARIEAGIAASLAPDSVAARSALIERAMADHRYREAQRMMDALLADYPEDQSVRRLARELDAKRRWLFEAEAKPGNSDGGGANASAPRTLGIGHACMLMDGFNVEKVLKALGEAGVKPRGNASGPVGPLVSYVRMRGEEAGGVKGGTPELYFSDPDGILWQLQDTTYCGGGGYLGEVCRG